MTDSDSIWTRAGRLQAAGKAFAIVTVVRSEAPTSAKPGAKAIVHADGTIEGWIGGGCAQPAVLKSVRDALQEGRPRLIRISPERSEEAEPGVVEFGMACHSGGTLDIFIDPVATRPVLLIVGASPAGQMLSVLARQMDFEVHVAASEATHELFPQADRVFDAADGITLTAPAFVVVATQGRHDEAGLEAALATGALYIAFIASRRKADRVKQYLKDRGHDAERVDAIIAPAGMPGSATTPEEIALSVLTGIVQARRAGLGAVSPAPLTSGAPEGVVATVVEIDAMAAQPQAATDPVCGMSVDPSNTPYRSEYRGRIYYFCCAHCRQRFEQTPEQFLEVSTR